MFLQLEGISFSYPGSGCALFSGLSLSFSEGWTVIAGANGTGKSTLISIASGLLMPDSGRVRRSGDVILCPQVFEGLQPGDWSDIFSGDNHVGMLKSSLSLTDEMIEREQSLSGGEKKRHHLDAYSRDLMVRALRTFSGIGIIVSHDRTFASALSHRTILLERGTDEAASIEDIPLPLPEALDESERRRKSGRSSYDSILSAISEENAIAAKLSERSREKQRGLSKRGISSKDHDAKAKIDGARLTGRDASLDGAMRNHISHSRQLEEKLSAMGKPLMRKEGLTLITGMHVPDLSFPESILTIGDYTLSVPALSIKAGSHIALKGRNGSGKTLFLRSFHEHLIGQGRERHVLYLPQEFTGNEISKIITSFLSLEDDEKGMILSDMYRMGSNPSALFSNSLALSPGEMKKLAIALSRREGRSVLLMDEPTNHLDIVSMRILERMFREDGKNLTMILVSHDESFLSACTDTVWEIIRDGQNGRLTT